MGCTETQQDSFLGKTFPEDDEETDTPKQKLIRQEKRVTEGDHEIDVEILGFVLKIVAPTQADYLRRGVFLAIDCWRQGSLSQF